MNISLTPQLEKLVKRKVASGSYQSPSQVMHEALRLLDEYDQLREARLAELRKDIQQGLESGESTPLHIKEIKAKARRQHSSQ